MSSEKEREQIKGKRYDEKLFKQAYRAAIQAKALEERLRRRKQILKFVCIVFLLIFLVLATIFFLRFFNGTQDYIETGNYPAESIFLPITGEEISKSVLLQVPSVDVKAQGVLAVNPANGNIIYQREMHERLPVASLTKIMTVIVTLENFNLDDVVEVSVENMPESVNWSLKLKEGDKITVSNLIKAMLIPSFNDAAYAIANAYPNGGYVGFVKEMNRRAKVIGMNNTLFVNPSGWDEEGAYSTAYDIAILTSVARKYPYIVDTVSQTSETIYWSSNDDLVSEKVRTTNLLANTTKYVKGFKTGITDLSGPCFVGYFVYSDNDELITVVLNSKQRFEDTKLLESVYRLKR